MRSHCEHEAHVVTDDGDRRELHAPIILLRWQCPDHDHLVIVLADVQRAIAPSVEGDVSHVDGDLHRAIELEVSTCRSHLDIDTPLDDLEDVGDIELFDVMEQHLAIRDVDDPRALSP